MNSRKFLDDIGYIDDLQELDNDPRYARLREQKRVYGFDDRDTWNLNTTMVALLYERLKMYDEVNNVDTSFHTVKHGNATLTMQQVLDLMLELAEEVLTFDNSEYSETLFREEEAYFDLEDEQFSPNEYGALEEESFSFTPLEWTQRSYWFFKRRQAIESDAFFAEKELWELWAKSFIHFWW